MKFLFLLFAAMLLSVFSTTSFAQEVVPAVRFKNGSDITVERLSGSVTYYCRDHIGNSYTRNWYCNADLVSPGTHDHVIKVSSLDADKVTLTATREDGSIKTKTVAFDTEKSISKTRVNLLMNTLTQKPLLKIGSNTVAFKLTKGSQIVEEGAFISTVTESGTHQCKHRSQFASNPSQCDNQMIGCDNYFYLENNCKY